MFRTGIFVDYEHKYNHILKFYADLFGIPTICRHVAERGARLFSSVPNGRFTARDGCSKIETGTLTEPSKTERMIEEMEKGAQYGICTHWAGTARAALAAAGWTGLSGDRAGCRQHPADRRAVRLSVDDKDCAQPKGRSSRWSFRLLTCRRCLSRWRAAPSRARSCSTSRPRSTSRRICAKNAPILSGRKPSWSARRWAWRTVCRA